MPAQGAVTLFLNQYGGGTINLGMSIETASAWIETKALDFGEASFVKFLEKITSHIRQASESPNLVLEIRGSDYEDGPFVLLDTINLSLEDPAYTDPPGHRFFKIRYSDSLVGVRWALHGFTVHGEIGGEEF